jgi:putative peptidoglycan lipid II flippase
MFHAHNDTRTPVVASALNLLTFVALSLLLMEPMQHAGLAAATTCAAVVQLGALLWLLRRRAGRLGLREVATSLARVVAASAVMGLIVWALSQLGHWSLGGNNPRNLVVFAGTVGAGTLSYLGVTAMMGAPELGDLRSAIRRRVRA